MIHEIKGIKINTIGDPHLGREFKTGVPLHRRGEREESVWRDFERRLDEPCDMSVMMGDIFDRFVVPPEVVIRAAMAYRQAAAMRIARQFVLLRGNHDASKDADKKSSFDLLAELLANVPNIYVIKDEPKQLEIKDATLAFFSYHPFKTAAELAESLPGSFTAAFGHWDVDSFGGDDSQLIPLDVLADRCPTIFTGHVHSPGERNHKNCKVVITGSLQPYSHAEDVTGEVYVTCDLETAKSLAEAGKLRDKCVRVLIQPGEALDFEIDCLALTTKAVDAAEDDSNLEVNIEAFDFLALFKETFKEHGVSDETTALALEKYAEVKA